MPRHSTDRTPWRQPNRRRNRAVLTEQQSAHTMRHFRRKNGPFEPVITFRKTASRSFRYLSLSLQNGVLRNQGDTGVRALPHYQSLGQSQSRWCHWYPAPCCQSMCVSYVLSNQSAGWALSAHCTKCRGSEPHTSLFKFQTQWETRPDWLDPDWVYTAAWQNYTGFISNIYIYLFILLYRQRCAVVSWLGPLV